MNDDIVSMCDDLAEAAELSSDENGEYWKALLAMYDHAGTAPSRLNKAVEAEIRSEYMRLKRDFRIVTETVTPKPQAVQRLQHYMDQ